MLRTQKFIPPLMALVLVASLLGPAALNSRPEPATARIQPQLAALAAETPEQMVRVIIRKTGASDQAEALVQKLGGEILKDLHIINAFAAELSAAAINELAYSPAVGIISLDAPVVSTGRPTTKATYYLLDTFSTVAYNNNDGLASFTTEWIEEDPAEGGPVEGRVWIQEDQYTKCDNSICYLVTGEGELRLANDLDTGTQPSAAREADLSDGVTSAMLSYTFSFGEGTQKYVDVVVLEVSTDGGETYTTLNSFSFAGGTTGTAYSNIIDYASAQTRFRFRIQSGFNAPEAYFAFDNFQIEYEGNTLPNNIFLDTLKVQEVWDMGHTGAGIGVAVIDSGISNDRDLNTVARVSFNPNSNTVNDVYGHGTHVAGIIAMDGSDSGGHYLGIAPDAHLISLKISDENGLAYESDTVDAMQWVFDHKDQYNIRVVNLSIQSTVEQSYHDSALSAAAEILWFNGVVVVAATGNWYGGNVYPLNVAPGNDPFVITVGAADEKGTTRINDDYIPNFSAWGNTIDGFMKPEIFAPGVDIISVLSKDSSWHLEHPERAIFGDQYVRVSGTSMATPMVSGAVALLLQAEPDLTPDQVKYRVMHAHNWVGAGKYLSIYKMLTTPTTESANQGVIPHILLAKMAMIAYWANENGGETIDWGSVDWDAVNWDAVNWDAVNWNAVNWNAVNWNAVNWNAVNWNAVNWNAVNWNAVNWNAVNWNAVNWNAVHWED